MTNFKDYKRFPIQLGEQTIMLLHVYRNTSEDVLMQVSESQNISDNLEGGYAVYKVAAEQFIKQLEGHYSNAFLTALIVEAVNVLHQGDLRRNEAVEGTVLAHLKESRAKKALDLAIKVISKED